MAQHNQSRPTRTAKSGTRTQASRTQASRTRATRTQNPYDAPYDVRSSQPGRQPRRTSPTRQARAKAPAHAAPSHARRREPEPRRSALPIVVAVLALVFVGLLVVFFLRTCGGGGATGTDAAQQAQGASEVQDASATSDAAGDAATASPDDADDSTSSAKGTAADKTSADERLDTLVLVNKEYELPAGWEDKLDLVGETNVKGEYVEVDRIAYDAFKALTEDLEENEGITFQLNSGYRSVEAQQEIWDWLAESEGEDYARTVAAEPGHSEHHTGLAIDALLVVDGEPMVAQDQIDEHDYEFGVMYDHLAEYGFVLRYLEGKENITGYDFAHEKWHIRYVGVEAAKQMMAEPRTTLEEYLGKLPTTDVSPAE